MTTTKRHAIANLIAQGVAFTGFIEIANRYGATQFGIFATFNSICWVTAVIATLQLEHILPIAKGNTEHKALTIMAIVSVTFFSLIAFSISAAVVPLVDRYNLVQGYKIFAALLMMTVYLIGISQIMRGELIRQGSINIIIEIGLYVPILSVLLALALSAFTKDWWGIALGQVLAYMTVTIIVAARLKIREKISIFFHEQWKEKAYLDSTRIYMKPTASLLISNMMKTLSARVPYILMGFFYPAAIVGSMSIGERISAVPALVASNAISARFRADSARDVRLTGEIGLTEIRKAYVRRQIRSYRVALPIYCLAICIVLFAKDHINAQGWPGLLGFVVGFLVVEYFRFAYACVEESSAIAKITGYRATWEAAYLASQIILFALPYFGFFEGNPSGVVYLALIARIALYIIDALYVKMMTEKGELRWG